MSNIGERHRQKREERGWSQSELARRMVAAGYANYNQVTVARTEQGQRPVRMDEAVLLADVLSVDLVWLATGDERRGESYNNGFRDGLDAARKAVASVTS